MAGWDDLGTGGLGRRRSWGEGALATKSHARRAVQHGASREEVEQAVALAVNPVGFPRTVMAWQWVTEQLEAE